MVTMAPILFGFTEFVSNSDQGGRSQSAQETSEENPSLWDGWYTLLFK